jgi:amino acid transporter
VDVFQGGSSAAGDDEPGLVGDDDGLARNRYYPQIFQRTDRHGIPWFSLIMSFVFGIFFLLPFPSWQALVGLVSLASVLMYAGAPLSLGAFRGQVPDAARPFDRPTGKTVLAWGVT